MICQVILYDINSLLDVCDDRNMHIFFEMRHKLLDRIQKIGNIAIMILPRQQLITSQQYFFKAAEFIEDKMSLRIHKKSAKNHLQFLTYFQLIDGIDEHL